MRNTIRLGLAACFLFTIAIGCQTGRNASPVESAARGGRASVEVADLRCEYLSDPLGIDVGRPRLGWRLAAVRPEARGLRQSAYQVFVAGSREALGQDRGDLWDSGQVKSDQSAHIAYGGKALGSGEACYWKVRVWDQDGRASDWSKPARWSMGLLKASDWKAQWIGAAPPTTRPAGARQPAENTLADPWFRKSFTLDQSPQRAIVYVASVGYHELYVNGKKIGDEVLEPAVTDYTQRARYVSYDITDALKKGPNAIGLWLGVSWSIYPPYKTADKPQIPLVMAQGDIELADGRKMQLVTDSTWKTHASPNMLLGAWNFTNMGGELYDANREMPGWCEAGLDDSAWQPASVFQPKLVLSAEMVEPNRCVKPIRAVGVEQLANGDYRVDMGVNFSGFVEIDVSGAAGKRIDFQFSEDPKQAMTHRIRSAYIIGPSGKGTFRNHFNYSCGRWITIKGLASQPTLDSVRGQLVRTDYGRAGQFECSNKLFNEIYKTTLWTFENLSLGGYVVDCPQRERMGYGGDAHATIDTALGNYSLGAFYTKWSQDWRDVQGKESIWGVGERATHSANAPKEEGNLPYTAPTYWGGGGPGWCGICITMPWRVYRCYGDVRILEDNFPTMQRWLAFLESKSANDMLVRWGGEWDFLGDWLWPGAKGVNGDTPETLFFNNCYWIYNLQTAAKVADVLGKSDVAARYRKRADAVRRAVHAKFFNAADNSYVNGFQAYLSIALLVDLPPQELRAAVMERLEDEILVKRNGHIWAGITGGSFVLRELMRQNRDELIFAMASKEDFPGWGDMLKRGATTMWESWEGNISLLHSSYLYIGAWFTQGLGGIQLDPEVAGYKAFVIRPGAMAGKGVDWVKASYESLYGTIVSEWKLEGGKLRVHVRVPPNTRAKLLMPARQGGVIEESGKALNQAAGVKEAGRENGRMVLMLESGDYRFEGDF